MNVFGGEHDIEPTVLLDPNKLSTDGTVALSGVEISDDGNLMAYGLSVAGSDWQEWRVRDVRTAADLPDVIKWVKFSGASWAADGSGFYYSRYDEPTEADVAAAALLSNGRHGSGSGGSGESMHSVMHSADV